MINCPECNRPNSVHESFSVQACKKCQRRLFTPPVYRSQFHTYTGSTIRQKQHSYDFVESLDLYGTKRVSKDKQRATRIRPGVRRTNRKG